MNGDPRIEAYARLLVEECLDVQSGWQVVVSGGMLGRPLVEDVCRAGRGPRRLCDPAAQLHGLGIQPAVGPKGTGEAARQPGADRRACLPRSRRLDRDRGPREHTRARRPCAGALRPSAGRDSTSHRAGVHVRAEVGRLPVSDRGARAGRGHVRHRVRGLSLRRVPARLVGGEGADEPLRRALRRGRGGADRRERDGHHAERRRTQGRWSTRAGRTCPAASSSTRRSRTRPRGRSRSPSSRRSTAAGR